jgi:hypothetical protein
MDDGHLFGTQQLLRDDQASQRVLGSSSGCARHTHPSELGSQQSDSDARHHSLTVPDNMRIAKHDPQRGGRIDPCVHADHHGDPLGRREREMARGEGGSVGGISGEVGLGRRREEVRQLRLPAAPYSGRVLRRFDSSCWLCLLQVH